jgi:hypothetical protein
VGGGAILSLQDIWGTVRTLMARMPILEQFKNSLKLAPLCQVRRTDCSGIRIAPVPLTSFGL